jgi:cell volume regulation protein A
LLVLVGLLLGRSGFGLITLAPDLPGIQILVIAGAAYILFRGGTTLEFRVLRSTWLTLGLLVTVGVLLTGLVSGAAAAYVFGLPYVAGVLIGAVIASTDPATLIPLLEQVTLPARLKQTILAESALNDATGSIFTFAVLPLVLGSAPSAAGVATDFVWQVAAGLGIGGAGGLAVGLLMAEGGWLRAHSNAMLLGLVILSYSAAEAIGASGFMAAFTAGLVVGNIQYSRFRANVAQHERTTHYLDATSGIFRIFLFVLLGSQLDLHRQFGLIVPAVLTALVLMLVARPVAVVLCALPDRAARWTLADLTFLSWSRETGVIPAALVAALAARHAPHIAEISAVTTVAILITILIQGSTARPLARALRLTPSEARTGEP